LQLADTGSNTTKMWLWLALGHRRIFVVFIATATSRTFAWRREVGPSGVLSAAHDLLFLFVGILVARQAVVDDALVIVSVIAVTCGVLHIDQLRTVHNYTTNTAVAETSSTNISQSINQSIY